MRPPTRWFLACLLLSGALTLIVGRDVLFSGKTFTPTDLLTSRPPWGPPEATDAYVQNHLHQDILEFFAMHALWSSKAQREGESILWNPHLFCGYPAAADPQLQTFYPPRVLVRSVFPALLGLDLLLLFHFFAAGPAMFACLRATGAGGPAALVAAAVWMLCGQQMVWFKYGCGGVAAVFLPLVALALHRAGERRSLGWAAGAGALWGVMFTGANPQLSFLALVWTGVSLALMIRPHGTRWTAAAAAAFALPALGLAAVQLLPFLEAFFQSARSLYPDVTNFSRPWRTPLLLLTLFWQRIWGSPIDRLDLNFTWMGVNFFEFQGYAGLLALLAAAWAWRTGRRFAWIALAFLAVATLYPIWWLFITLLPPLSALGPHRLFLFSFALSILAGLGLERALATPPGRRLAVLGGLAAGAVVLLGLGGLALSKTWISLGNPSYLALAIASVGTAAVLFVLRSAASPALKAAAAAAAVVADLLPGFLAYNAAHAPLPPVPALIANLPADSRAVFTLESRYWRFLFRTYLMMADRDAPGGFASLYPARYAEAATALGGAAETRTVHFPPAADRAFRFLDVRTVVTPAGVRTIDSLPRAWLAGRVEVLDRDRRLKRLADPAFDPAASAILDPSSVQGVPGPAGAGRVERVRRDVYRVDCANPSLLVTSESWDAGWTCTVDGVPLPVLQVNHAFRAVFLAAGKHEVTFRYRPASVRWGAWISALTALSSIAASLLACSRRWKASAGGGR